MFELIDADLFNSENLVNGKITEIITDLNALKNIKENDDHYFTGMLSVYDYLVKSVAVLEKMIDEDPYFNKIEEKHTKARILVIACIFRFMGKPDTLERDSEGYTRCFNYEVFSSELALSQLKRTSLTDREIRIVTDIIRNSVLLQRIIRSDNNSLDQDISNHKSFLGSMFKDLLYLFMADAESSELKNTDKNEYEFIKVNLTDIMRY